jgi:hypothetical protein
MEYPKTNVLLRLPKKFRHSQVGSTERFNAPPVIKKGRRAAVVHALEPLGPKGGKFYLNSKGKKVYVGKKSLYANATPAASTPSQPASSSKPKINAKLKSLKSPDDKPKITLKSPDDKPKITLKSPDDKPKITLKSPDDKPKITLKPNPVLPMYTPPKPARKVKYSGAKRGARIKKQ